MRARLDLSQEGRVSRMARAMLIMDMPEACYECPCEADYVCQAKCKEIDEIDKVQEWCPLREVPQKADIKKAVTMTTLCWCEGYNACIDEILGGGE